MVEATQLGPFDEDGIAYTPYDSGLGTILDPDNLVELPNPFFTVSVEGGGTILRATYVGPDLRDFFTNAPTDIVASSASFDEDVILGATLATLVATHPLGDSHTFALITGDGSTDNGKFTVVGNELRLSSPLDFESAPSLEIRLRATDTSNRYLEKIFTVIVVNVTSDDDDEDGLTEAEETALGTDALSSDSDNDGINDGDEVNGWGTNPLDNNDRFKFADSGGTELVGDQFTIRWETKVGKNYKMEGTITLGTSSWDELPGTIPGTGGDVSFTITLEEGSYSFFRVKVLE